MGTTLKTLGLVRASLDLLEQIFTCPQVNMIQQNLSYISLPWQTSEMEQMSRSETMVAEFAKKGGVEALEQLQYSQNSAIYIRVKQIIKNHFSDNGSPIKKEVDQIQTNSPTEPNHQTATETNPPQQSSFVFKI